MIWTVTELITQVPFIREGYGRSFNEWTYRLYNYNDRVVVYSYLACEHVDCPKNWVLV